VVLLKPRDPIPWCQWDRGIGSRGFNEMAGTNPAVSMRPRDRILNETAGSSMASRDQHKNDYWLPLPLKGKHKKKNYISKHHIHIVTRNCKYERGNLTKKSDPAVPLTPQDKVLATYESLFSANSKPYSKRL
jgi:hypothetical protein